MLTSGDRIPNFERPDRQGRLCTFYKQDFPKPLVLVCLYRSNDPAAHDVLEALARPAALWDRVERMALTQERDTQGRELPFLVLQDDGTLLTHLAGDVGQTSAVVFALDANLRVIERLEISGSPADLIDKLDAIYAAVPVEPAQTLRQPAPVLMIPRVLEPAFCRQLIDEFEVDGGESSGVSYVENGKTIWKPDPAVKQRRDFYSSNPGTLDAIKTRVGQRVLPEIHKAFQFEVTRHEPFKMVCYESDPGGYFRPHRDNDSRAYAHRRFAMTINLNTGDYTGGDLCFPEYGPHGYEAGQGGAIIFSCSLLHEARDVTAGKRYALLGFFFGENDENPSPRP